MPRPKPKNFESKVQKVLDSVTNGESVRASCKKHGIPISTFVENVDSEHYARARSSCADAQFDEIKAWEQRLLDGELDPAAAKVAIDARKWRLARMKPSEYGEKQKVDIVSSDGTMSPKSGDLSSLSFEELSKLADKIYKK